MVAEPWIQKMRKKKNQIKNHTPSPALAAPPSAVGILSFEVATAMSRAVHLHRSLADPDRLSSLLFSPSILSLVSADKSFLISLAVFEKLDDLNRVATVASRLGRSRCPHLPALSGFEHVYSDLLRRSNPNPVESGNYFLFSAKEMDSAVRRMERFVSSTSALYAELEVLSDLEHSIKKIPDTDGARRAFEQKIQWQRHDVRQLRDSSLWNQTFDKVVLLLCRAVCTIHARIRSVFGESAPDKSPNSQGNVVFRPDPLRLFNCGASPGRLFLNCLGSGDISDGIETETVCSAVTTFTCAETVCNSSFGPKSRLMTLASTKTVGGSCLALHYANVIIIIEKLLRYPHLVGDEARDDLYSMLPSSLKLALRKSLRSYVKNLAIYDASLAHDWKGAMETILSWLAPMAHNMIRWQTERNFEQQQIVTRENVLLLQTLYFADREKTEAAVCELLVGLNYICRYEQQQNALLDCTSSVDFDDCMDWQQMQFHSITERS